MPTIEAPALKPIVWREYENAVRLLTSLAQTDTSGGRVAAQVILSAYNGDEWQLDVTELGLLDDRYYLAAITVIRGRRELRVEPHNLIVGGREIFRRIWDRWRRYHVSNRWKQTCFNCNGRGEVVEYDDHDMERHLPCERCGGTGLVAQVS